MVISETQAGVRLDSLGESVLPNMGATKYIDIVTMYIQNTAAQNGRCSVFMEYPL